MTQKLENSLCLLWNAYCNQEDVLPAVKDFIQQNAIELSNDSIWDDIANIIYKFKKEHKYSTGMEVKTWDVDLLHMAHFYYHTGDVNMFNQFLNQFVSKSLIDK